MVTKLRSAATCFVRQYFTNSQGTFTNGFGVIIPPGAFDLPAATAIAGVASDAWNDNLKAVIDANQTFDKVELTDVREIGANQWVVDVGIAGTLAGDRLPSEVAGVLTLRTGFRDKRGRGRLFLFGFGETENTDDGQMASGLVDAIQAYGDQLLADLNTNGTPLGVISRSEPPVGYTGQIRQVLQVECRNTVFKAQRRRRPRG